MSWSFSFSVYVDEKSHLHITAEVREYEPVHRVWLLVGACQHWRGTYEGQGVYSRSVPLGDEFAINARAESIDGALRSLVSAALLSARPVL